MTLTFPNTSRFYDDKRRQIRFVGHDGMQTIPFRINIDAIMVNATFDLDDEEVFFRSFDMRRDDIQSVAREAYANKRQTVYVLTAGDFS